MSLISSIMGHFKSVCPKKKAATDASAKIHSFCHCYPRESGTWNIADQRECSMVIILSFFLHFIWLGQWTLINVSAESNTVNMLELAQVLICPKVGIKKKKRQLDRTCRSFTQVYPKSHKVWKFIHKKDKEANHESRSGMFSITV